MTFSPQDMGAGLAVVPLMGLLETIAVAKSFGEMPVTPPLPPTSPASSPPPGLFVYSDV